MSLSCSLTNRRTNRHAPLICPRVGCRLVEMIKGIKELTSRSKLTDLLPKKVSHITHSIFFVKGQSIHHAIHLMFKKTLQLFDLTKLFLKLYGVVLFSFFTMDLA